MANQISPRNNLKNVSKSFLPDPQPQSRVSPHISPRNQAPPQNQPDRTSFDFGFDSAPKVSPKQSPKAAQAVSTNLDFNFLDGPSNPNNSSGLALSPKMV